MLQSPLQSSLYETLAWPDPRQPRFLNSVVVGWSALSPEALLGFAKRLEFTAGRRPAARFAPRSLDVDLLFRGDDRRSRPELTLPHPQLAERRFVLEPLLEVAADRPIPTLGVTAEDLVHKLRERPT